MSSSIRVVITVGCVAAIAAGGLWISWTRAQPAPAGAGKNSSAYFGTLPPGAVLPTDEQCADRVRLTPSRETKAANKPFNETTGHSAGRLFPSADDARANTVLAVRIDGDFTGTTADILRWAACKWGMDEDMLSAQAAVESWWRQTNLGDWGVDASACPSDHGLGVDGVAGKCPESYGILQNRYSLERSAWPGLERSTSMNADVAAAIWRACFEGYELWLNDVERGTRYAAGDAWGCVGRWFAGRWHTSPADTYIQRVKADLRERVWEQPSFAET